MLCSAKLKSTHKVCSKGVDKATVHIGIVDWRQQSNVLRKARVEHLGELRIGRNEIQVVRVLQIDVDHLLCVPTPLKKKSGKGSFGFEHRRTATDDLAVAESDAIAKA